MFCEKVSNSSYGDSKEGGGGGNTMVTLGLADDEGVAFGWPIFLLPPIEPGSFAGVRAVSRLFELRGEKTS